MIMTKIELRQAAIQLDELAVKKYERTQDAEMCLVIRLISSLTYYVAGGKETKKSIPDEAA